MNIYKTESGNIISEKDINEILTNCKNQEIVVVANTGKINFNLLNNLPEDIKIWVEDGVPSDYKERRKSNEPKNVTFLKDLTEYDEPSIYNKEELQQIIAKIEEIEKNINPKWSKFQKAVYVRDYLSEKIKYNYNENNKNDRGLRGLLTYKSVCVGYSRIFKDIMDREKIPCEVANGAAIEELGANIIEPHGHAWNLLKIDGKLFPIDVTFASTAQDHKYRDIDSVVEFVKEHLPDYRRL